MAERRQPDFNPDDAVRTVAMELPDIETPVIDMQDLEHNAAPETRVNNEGVEVKPRNKEPRIADEEFAKADADALQALADFERQLKNLPPD